MPLDIIDPRDHTNPNPNAGGPKMEKLVTLHFTIANVTPEEVVPAFAKLFGGCTAVPTLGSWYNPEEEQVEIEPGTRVTLTLDEAPGISTAAGLLINQVLFWAKGRGEKAVFVEGGTAAEIMNVDKGVIS